MAMESTGNIDNILQLPTEILMEILSYVPIKDQSLQVCKKFYQIRSLNECRMKLYCSDNYSYIEDEIFQSIINSKRRVTSCFIFRKPRHELTNAFSLNKIFLQLEEIFQRFGGEIKSLQIWNHEMNARTLNLLNHLPNLNELVLKRVYCIDAIPKDFKLTLPMLTQIELIYCNEKVFKALDRLPDNVLNEIHIELAASVPGIDGTKHFLNQSNVKHAKVCGQANTILNFKNMKLKSLYIDGNRVNWDELTEGQTELKSLKCDCCLTIGDLEIVSRNLTSLEQLKLLNYWLVGHRVPGNWSSLQFAMNLRSLEVSYFDESFLTLQSKSLQELSISTWLGFDLSDANVATISDGCPNLRAIRIDDPTSVNDFNAILLYFPQIQTLSLRFDYFEPIKPVEVLQHHGLKKLRVWIRNFKIKNILKIIEMTLKLETFEMKTAVIKIDANLLQDILSTQPKLTVLRISGSFEFHSNLIDIFKNFGKNLEEFQIETDEGNYKNLRLLEVGLAIQFPVTVKINGRQLMMKKKMQILKCKDIETL